MQKKRCGRRGGICLLVCLLAWTILLVGCGKQSQESQKKEEKIRIGFSFDSMVIERWQRDRDVFVDQVQKSGGEVNVQNAAGDVATQKKQISYFIREKMDAIIIVAVDTGALSEEIKQAKDQGIPVVAYDRMLQNANVDLYLSFDSEQVGKLYAKRIAEKLPQGAKVLEIFGSPEDYNVKLMEKGLQEEWRKSYEVVEKKYAKGWLAEEAYEIVSKYLAAGKSCDAVICGNDDLAAQAILALSENRQAGKVYVLGQDGDLAACQRIVEGTQGGTAFKNVDELAKTAAKMCMQLAKGENVQVTEQISDGTYSVPCYQLEPVWVDKDNVDQVIIEGGFHTREEVYLNKKSK